MRLTVAGCSGSMPGPDGPASCYLLEEAGYRLVLDLGSGGLGALQRATDIYAVDAVALSHLHPDHCLDACALLVARRYGAGDRELPRLPVYGPPGTAERLARAYDATGSAEAAAPSALDDSFDVRAWRTGEAVQLGPFSVRPHRVRHVVECFGLRITAGGRTLAYSGDTDACPALVELARDADLFLCEASYAEDDGHPPGVHLSGRSAGQQATQAGARGLLLTHVPPWTDAAAVLAATRTSYGGSLQLARPGAAYDI